MRRLALLLAGGAIWLFLAAIPALADGGPHVASINDGSLGITSDNCAGCHRAHTAQGPYLLNQADEDALCLSCHGAAGTGSTVDVMTGVQYTLGTAGTVRGTTVLGALRNGGFDTARIGSGSVSRVATSTGALRTKVPARADAQPVTSAHLSLPDNGLTMPGIAWGNGAISAVANPGPAVEMSCGTCHNPHGNGQYRILNPIPAPLAEPGNTFTPVAAPGVEITDAPVPAFPADTRNYTVIAEPGPNYLLLASQVAGQYAPTDGDYFHRYVLWNTGIGYDAPNGLEASFNDQMTAWCSTCHTRYLASNFAAQNDAIYKRRHVTTDRQACTTCHVSHGSNAAMTGPYSSTYPYPNDTAAAPSASASSRLLKIDNRGTCQACHDPTGTIKPGDTTNPPPPSTTGGITGTVSAVGGGPISGARVQISGGASTTTNASGVYSFAGLASATYSLTALATGYTTSSPVPVSVTAPGTTTQNFALTASGGGGPTTGTINGTVTAASGGAAIVGATVQLSPGGASMPTNSSGGYSFTVAAGTYTVSVTASGYNPDSASGVDVAAGGTATRNFSLAATGGGGTGTLTGTVRNVLGVALPGATVTIQSGAGTTTNGSGVYTFINIAAGTYSVTASATGYLSSTATGVNVTTGGTTTRNFTLLAP